MATAEEKIPVTYKDKQKRIIRSNSVAEVFERIRRQFSLADDFCLKAKIGDKEFDIETQDDVADMLDAEEINVYSKELGNGVSFHIFLSLSPKNQHQQRSLG
jgi:putative IMPACT (imprinted ancient) family translation regulator